MSDNISSIVSLLDDTLRRRCYCGICETEIDESLQGLLKIEKDYLAEIANLRVRVIVLNEKIQVVEEWMKEVTEQ